MILWHAALILEAQRGFTLIQGPLFLESNTKIKLEDLTSEQS